LTAEKTLPESVRDEFMAAATAVDIAADRFLKIVMACDERTGLVLFREMVRLGKTPEDFSPDEMAAVAKVNAEIWQAGIEEIKAWRAEVSRIRREARGRP
jgi:hypothetical protein